MSSDITGGGVVTVMLVCRQYVISTKMDRCKRFLSSVQFWSLFQIEGFVPYSNSHSGLVG